MGLTHFPNGVASFGHVCMGSSYPIGQGNGVAYFCDPANGSDGNTGRAPDKAFASLSQAHSAMTANQGDVVYLYSTGQAAGSARQSATLTWTKDNTHIVGVTAPTFVSQRARLSTTSGATVFTPLMTVSADGFSMRNVGMFHGFANASGQTCLNVTGERNYFENVHIGGMGAQLAADHNDSSSLTVDGGSENLFRHCTIGLDTIERDSTGGEILFDGGATRNMFESCLILAAIDAAGHFMVKFNDTSSADRFVIFRDCDFISFSTNDGTAMTSAFNIPASHQTMRVLLRNCTSIGISDWDSNDRGNVWIDGAAPTAASSGIAVNTTA